MPAFVLSGGHSVRLGSRELRVDIAFGGVFYAIADTEAIGIPLTPERLPELASSWRRDSRVNQCRGDAVASR